LIGDRFDQTGEERANLSATLIKRTMLAIDGRHDACQHLQFFRKNSSASAYAAKLNMCIDTTFTITDFRIFFMLIIAFVFTLCADEFSAIKFSQPNPGSRLFF